MNLAVIKNIVSDSYEDRELVQSVEELKGCIFTSTILQKIKKDVEVKNIGDIHSFKGTIVAADLKSLTLASLAKESKIYFYIENPEWMIRQVLNELFDPIYQENVKLLAPSLSRKYVYEKIFSKEVRVMEGWRALEEGISI